MNVFAALCIDDGDGSATTVTGTGFGRPTITRQDDAESAEAFYDIVSPARLVWAYGDRE